MDNIGVFGTFGRKTLTIVLICIGDGIRDSLFILTSFSVQPRLNAKTSWVQGNEEMFMCSISNGK